MHEIAGAVEARIRINTFGLIQDIRIQPGGAVKASYPLEERDF